MYNSVNIYLYMCTCVCVCVCVRACMHVCVCACVTSTCTKNGWQDPMQIQPNGQNAALISGYVAMKGVTVNKEKRTE